MRRGEAGGERVTREERLYGPLPGNKTSLGAAALGDKRDVKRNRLKGVCRCSQG